MSPSSYQCNETLEENMQSYLGFVVSKNFVDFK